LLAQPARQSIDMREPMDIDTPSCGRFGDSAIRHKLLNLKGALDSQ
jgi:hypothetical protein